MPQRTITDARSQLDTLSQVMSQSFLEPLTAELEAAQLAAHEMADRQIDTLAGDAEELAASVQDELGEVRAGYTALISAGDVGSISARDFADQFNELRKRQRTAERRASELGRTAERLEQIERDPAAWADEFYDRFPPVRPNFSF
jgi:hypothetical protein